MPLELTPLAFPEDVALSEASAGADAVFVEDEGLIDNAMNALSEAAQEVDQPTEAVSNPTEEESSPTCSVLPPVDSLLAPGSGDPMGCYGCGSMQHWHWACPDNPDCPPVGSICTRCARAGHSTASCLSPMWYRPTPGVCYECGASGHAAYQCPVILDALICHVHQRARGRRNLYLDLSGLPRCKEDASCDAL
jgi:hypothetical protein